MEVKQLESNQLNTDQSIIDLNLRAAALAVEFKDEHVSEEDKKALLRKFLLDAFQVFSVDDFLRLTNSDNFGLLIDIENNPSSFRSLVQTLSTAEYVETAANITEKDDDTPQKASAKYKFSENVREVAKILDKIGWLKPAPESADILNAIFINFLQKTVESQGFTEGNAASEGFGFKLREDLSEAASDYDLKVETIQYELKAAITDVFKAHNINSANSLRDLIFTRDPILELAELIVEATASQKSLFHALKGRQSLLEILVVQEFFARNPQEILVRIDDQTLAGLVDAVSEDLSVEVLDILHGQTSLPLGALYKMQDTFKLDPGSAVLFGILLNRVQPPQVVADLAKKRIIQLAG